MYSTSFIPPTHLPQGPQGDKGPESLRAQPSFHQAYHIHNSLEDMMLDRQEAFHQVEDISAFNRTVQEHLTMCYEQQALQILLVDAEMEPSWSPSLDRWLSIDRVRGWLRQRRDQSCQVRLRMWRLDRKLFCCHPRLLMRKERMSSQARPQMMR